MNPSPATLSDAERQLFLDYVDHEFGIRGSDYGAARIDDAIGEVLCTTSYTSAAQLLDVLSRGETPKWLFDLVEYLTVGETYFLRDPAQIAALRETILPDLQSRRAIERQLRMWSAGCSTGEEPYTLAILLLEKHLHDWDITLVGTDVNRDSLRTAREGRYPAWSFRSTPDYMRDRYFEPVENGWRLSEPVRRMVRFAWMNLGADTLMPPAGALDLIVCRNVTIYFDDAATQRLYRALVNALSPDGWLMLGPSDPMPLDRTDLQRVEANGTVLWRRRRPAATRPATQPRLPKVQPVPPRNDVSSTPRVVAAAPVVPAQPRVVAAPVVPAEPRVVGAPVVREEPRVVGATVVREEPRVVGATVVPAEPSLPAPVISPEPIVPRAPDVAAELEAGLVALECGSAVAALEALRRATFRDPNSVVGHFGLARAYLETGDRGRAHAALLHTRRLLAHLAPDACVPDTDSMVVETLRQTIQTYLEGLHG